MADEQRQEWGSSFEFILTIISFAVGLGSVWRFPYLVFSNGGAVFVIIFFIVLVLVGIPLFMLELAIGQFSGLGPSHLFVKIAPISQGIGYAGLTITAFIGFYYNTIVAYCLYYLILSFKNPLPWTTCGNDWNTDNCAIRTVNMTCDEFNETYPYPKSPSEEFFYEEVLNLSEGIGYLGQLEWPLVVASLSAWIIVFLALLKGVQTLGKISYFTSTFPYVMLAILVVTGSILEGAGKGVKFYIGQIDTTKFYSAAVWKDATVQVFYVLGTCTGGLIAMSSFNNYKNNLLRDGLLIPLITCFTGIFAGFAIFTVLGHMSTKKCAEKFEDIVAAGPELTFIVFPEGLALIKFVPQLWSVLFFLMMLALGFGSEFSFMETFIVMLLDLFKKFFDSKVKIIMLRIAVCTIFFLGALSMASQAGFFILSLLNDVVAGYPLLIVGLLQVIVVAWVYGANRLVSDIESMIGKKPKWVWFIFKAQWLVICPVVILAVIVATIVLGGSELKVNNISMPAWANAIGWVIVAIPLSIIVICAIAQIYIHRKDHWSILFKPDDEYFDKARKNGYQIDNNNSSGIMLKDYKVTDMFNTNKVASTNDAFEF